MTRCLSIVSYTDARRFLHPSTTDGLTHSPWWLEHLRPDFSTLLYDQAGGQVTYRSQNLDPNGFLVPTLYFLV